MGKSACLKGILSAKARQAAIALLLTLTAGLGSATADVQSPYLVRDINPGSTGSAPAEFVWAQGPQFSRLFFGADDGQHGHELWTSDGKTGGAALVKDINPGPGHSYPAFLTNVGGTVFFRADDGQHGYELWKSDGTQAGTVLVKDINRGQDHAYPAFLAAVDGALFFRADDGEHGYEIWASDGTAKGTKLVRDIQPGDGGSSPERLLAVDSDWFRGVLFYADDGLHGIEPWRSDGSQDGTSLLRDIAPGLQDSGPGSMAIVENSGFQGLLFTADDGATARSGYGEELWRSDGTGPGTMLVKDINPGPAGSQPGELRAIHHAGLKAVFFGARDGENGHGYELWRSDGTLGGTVLVRDINPGPADSNPCHLAPVSNSRFSGILFCADNGVHGPELWKSDGTAAGTALVKDINPGPEGSSLASPSSIWARVYFQADDGAGGHGSELWASDATAGGTALVNDVNPGSDGSYPALLTGSTGTHPRQLYFRADDGDHGRELWAMELSTAQYLPLLAR